MSLRHSRLRPEQTFEERVQELAQKETDTTVITSVWDSDYVCWETCLLALWHRRKIRIVRARIAQMRKVAS
jgi:hypothetical protein